MKKVISFLTLVSFLFSTAFISFSSYAFPGSKNSKTGKGVIGEGLSKNTKDLLMIISDFFQQHIQHIQDSEFRLERRTAPEDSYYRWRVEFTFTPDNVRRFFEEQVSKYPHLKHTLVRWIQELAKFEKTYGSIFFSRKKLGKHIQENLELFEKNSREIKKAFSLLDRTKDSLEKKQIIWQEIEEKTVEIYQIVSLLYLQSYFYIFKMVYSSFRQAFFLFGDAPVYLSHLKLTFRKKKKLEAFVVPLNENFGKISRALYDISSKYIALENSRKKHVAFEKIPERADLFFESKERKVSLYLDPDRILYQTKRNTLYMGWMKEEGESSVKRIVLKVFESSQDQKTAEKIFQNQKALPEGEKASWSQAFFWDTTETTHKPFVVLEYVEGLDLRAFLDWKKKQAGKAFSIELAVYLTLKIAEALQDAHEHGRIHGDLKLENILITPSGEVYLTDFENNFSQENSDSEVRSSLTHSLTSKVSTENLVFSLSNFAPEVKHLLSGSLRNIPITEKIDQYALGMILFELIVGAPPYGYSKIQEQNLSLPAEKVALIDDLIFGKLLKDPEHRFKNTKELVDRLKKISTEITRGQVWNSYQELHALAEKSYEQSLKDTSQKLSSQKEEVVPAKKSKASSFSSTSSKKSSPVQKEQEQQPLTHSVVTSIEKASMKVKEEPLPPPQQKATPSAQNTCENMMRSPKKSRLLESAE